MTQLATSNLCAQDIMSFPVVTIEATSSLRSAWYLLTKEKLSGAPVVDEDGSLVGVVSQHDLVRHIMAQADSPFERSSFYYALPVMAESSNIFDDSVHRAIETTVQTVMNPYVIAVAPTASLASIAAAMEGHHIHRVIVSEADRILGIISTFDLIRLFNT